LTTIFVRTLIILFTMAGWPAPIAAAAAEVPEYTMTLTAHPSQHSMEVEGKLILPPAHLAEGVVKLHVSRAAGAIVWTSRTPGVRIRARRQPIGKAPDGNDSAVWELSGNWPRQKPLAIAFRYRVVTPEPVGFLYLGPEVSFGIKDWYPAIDDVKVAGTLRILAPKGSVIMAGGQPQANVRTGRFAESAFTATTPTSLVFAISPPGSPTLSISPKLQLTTLKRRPTDSGWNVGLLGVQRALEAEFGPLPFPQVSVVEVPSAIADKANFGAVASPGAILASTDFIDQPFNVAAFAHEFAHLWWGHVVGFKGEEGEKGDFLLDEGLSQYASMVAVDQVLGTAAGSRYRYRGIPGFNETLFSATGFLKISAAGLDRPLLALQDDALSYWIAYSKAGLVWYALGEHMGRDSFRAGLCDVLSEKKASYITWDEFLAILQRRSAEPLQSFVEPWFGALGAPCYSLAWRASQRDLVGRISQCASIKPATLEVEVTGADGTRVRHRVAVPAEGAAISLPLNGRIRGVALDPDFKVLRWTPDLRTEANAMAQYMQALVLARINKNAEAERVLHAILRREPSDNSFDRLLLAHATLARLSNDRGCRECATAHIAAALRFTPTLPERLAPTYLGLHLRARRLGRKDLADRAAALALASDALVANANGAAQKISASK
jgi:tetratricopeptide (TPR) repeat protein